MSLSFARWIWLYSHIWSLTSEDYAGFSWCDKAQLRSGKVKYPFVKLSARQRTLVVPAGKCASGHIACVEFTYSEGLFQPGEVNALLL